MARPVFAHDTTKKIIGAFASIIDEIQFENGHGKIQKVPLNYAPKEKFLEDITRKPDMGDVAFDIVLPKIAFVVEGQNFAPERHTNPLGRIHDQDGKWVYNRVPWDFTVSVFVAATKIIDGNRIIEQILPFFTPEFTITVRDIPELDLKTNIPIVLNSISLDQDYEGSFNSHRTLMWTMQFTVKAFLYQNIVASERIKKTIIDLRNSDYDRIFERLGAEVVPRDAEESDPHEIVETVEFPDGKQ